MANELSGPLTMNMKAGDIICAAGEHDYDLYMVHSGKLLVFVNDKSKVTPLAYIKPGSYLGEFSFFDKQPRSAHIICVEDSTLIKIPVEELDKQAPRWLITLAQHVSRKLRVADQLIAKKGIRKKNVETVKPLSIDEHRQYFQTLENYKKENNISD